MVIVALKPNLHLMVVVEKQIRFMKKGINNI